MGEESSERRVHSPEFKFKVVKECLTSGQGVSEVCRKYGINPNIYYRWQEQFLKSAKDGFTQGKSGPNRAEQRQIEQLENENSRMKDVIAEITAENIEFKKKNIF